MFKTRNLLIVGTLLLTGVIAFTGTRGARARTSRATADPQLAHIVYFKLKDNSSTNRAKLVAACKLHLTGHPGTVYFATGTRAGDLNGEVNDREFDVVLHLVFTNKEAHDKYQEHARHKKFIEENLENLEKVRVFDSYLSPSPTNSAEPAEK
jgi:hypothetical protein